MALDASNYLVTREIALRTGEIQNHYRTTDGRFILDKRALSIIRFTSDEYINGLSGVEKISKDEALTLIAKGGYHLGDSEDETPIENEQEGIKEEKEVENE